MRVINNWKANFSMKLQQGGTHSGTIKLLKVVMLADGFVHFTMALSVEGVHKRMLYYIAKEQQNFINYNTGAQFINQ